MYDVRHLFRKLAERDRTAEERVRLSVLRELLTHTVSFAAFFRAAQAVEFAPLQPDRETSIAMLMAFRIQQLLAPNASREELATLRQTTREQIEEGARGYAEMIINSGFGRLKDGIEFPSPLKKDG